MTPFLRSLYLCALGAFAGLAPTEASDCWVYFGTAGTQSDRGIYLSHLNTQTGSLSPAERVGDKANSQFLTFSPDHRHLYSLADVGVGGSAEAIETYAVDSATGRLTGIGEQVCGGPESSHLCVNPSGTCLLAANYAGGYVEVFPIRADASVGTRSCLVRHFGSGPNAARQQSAHPHSVNVDPSGRFAVVADLGQDKVFVYRLDPSEGKITPNEPAYASVPPGSGPRHFAFHPDGRHAFVINEMTGTITAFNWDAERGLLTPYRTVSLLRKDFQGLNTSAEVAVGLSGRFVYGSNRGDDSIVVHSFDSRTGELSFVQRIGEGIKVPRNFAIDPSGRWLVCANLGASTASVFRVDAETGRLAFVGSIAVPKPECVRFRQE